MPTFVHGKFANIKIGNASAVLYDISSITNSADAPQSVATAETSAFGSQAKTFIVGLNDQTVSISGQFDAAIDLTISATIDALCAGTIPSIPVEWSPAGTATGNPKYTMQGIITSYDCSAPVGGVVTIKLDIQRTGARTRTVW